MTNNSTKSLFGVSGKWISRKYYQCLTPGMQLWMGIQFLKYAPGISIYEPGHRPRVFQAFPGTINPDCRCRDCRYFRMLKRANV